MKLMKSLLLGTAAGFAAVAGAQAADLPTKKAAPVEYVRICSLGGGAFVGYVIPGSDVCLKVGGFARWQYSYGTPSNSLLYVNAPGDLGGLHGDRGYGSRTSGQYAVGAVTLDARTQTEYGLLRSFADLRADAGFGGGSAFIDKAWVQLGGFQAGKYQSYFDFYADAFNNLGQLGSDHSVVGAAYTAIFGNFSAALSLEDASSTFGVPNYYGLAKDNTPYTLTAGGYRMPDVVGRLLYADSWGQVQLSAALHQVRANIATGGDGISKDNTDYGWAVQGGVKLNVPTFGPGDALYLQAAYASGALQYVGATGVYGFGKATQLTYAADALPIGADGSLKQTKGWNVLGAFQHSWTPSVSTALWASYTAINYASGAVTGSETLTGRDFHYWQAGVQANWSPVKNLTFSGTVNYINLSAHREAWDEALPAGSVGYKKSSDGVGFALRVQRDF